MLTYLALGTLAVTSVLLFVAGAERNADITRLHQQAVAVEMTVGECRGLLGGSGSNPVGYSCWGSFTLDGRTYRDGIPGDALLAPGQHLRMLTVPGDASLVDTPRAVASEHASASRYVLPGALLAALVASVACLAFRRMRRPDQPVSRSPLALGRSARARLGEAVGGV